MKLGDIKKACLDTRVASILDCGENGIWLSNGRAAWPAPDAGWDENTLPEIFDMTPKERETVAVVKGANPRGDWGYMGPGEGERPLWPVRSLEGLLLLSTEREPMNGDLVVIRYIDIRPARSKEETTMFFLRPWPGGFPVVVGYNGMTAAVLAMPLSEEAVAKLQSVLRRLADMPIYPTGGRAEGDGEQISMEELCE